MSLFIALPFALQGMIMIIDEFYFHHQRGLPLWERIGHPIDTFSIIICYAIALYLPFQREYILLFIGLAIFSSLLITKDEFIHHQYCLASEQWLHALLFVLHPVVLALTGLIWFLPSSPDFLPNLDGKLLFIVLKIQFILTLFYLLYQIIYWNFYGKNNETNPQ